MAFRLATNADKHITLSLLYNWFHEHPTANFERDQMNVFSIYAPQTHWPSKFLFFTIHHPFAILN